MRRTSVDDVARHGRIGRMTIYRRFDTRAALEHAVIARELQRFLAALDAFLDTCKTVEEAVVESFVLVVRSALNQPLISRLMETEPEALLVHVTTNAEPFVDLTRAYVAQRIERAAVELGATPTANIDTLAEVVVRLTQSYLLTPAHASDEDLRAVARGCILPAIQKEST